MNEADIKVLRDLKESFVQGFPPRFHQFGIKAFYSLVMAVPGAGIILDDLLVSEIKLKVEQAYTPNISVSEALSGFTEYHQYIGFCWGWIKHAIEHPECQNQNFVNKWSNSGHDPDRVRQTAANCFEPIITFLEKVGLHELNAISVLQRYKIFSEFFESIDCAKSEPDITRMHLGKFLFLEGYTHVLSEAVVSSGRVDSIADFAALAGRYSKRGDAIVIEGKYFDKTNNVIQEVYNQISRRLDDLSINLGFAVIYCKTIKEPNYTNCTGVNIFPYFERQGKKIYMINISCCKNKSTDNREFKDIYIT